MTVSAENGDGLGALVDAIALDACSSPSPVPAFRFAKVKWTHFAKSA